MAHQRDGGDAGAETQKRKLVAVPKTKDPGSRVGAVERGIAADGDPQRGRIKAYEKAEAKAERGAERPLTAVTA